MRRKGFLFLVCILLTCMLAGCGTDRSKEDGSRTEREEASRGGVMKESGGKSSRDKEENEEEEESILEGAQIFSQGTDVEISGRDIDIVLDGIKLRIPGEYGCYIDENKGPIVYRDDLFTMLLGVRDDSYRERMKDPESLMEGAIKAGGDITREIDEIKIDGKSYSYFTFTMDGDDFLVVFTEAGDSDKRLCAEMIVESSGMADEELLSHFAQIAKSARQTNDPDTTEEILMEAQRIADFGDQKFQSILAYGSTKITFGVSDGFYSTYAESDEYGAVEYFDELSYDREVDCYLRPTEDEGDAEYFIDGVADMRSGNGVEVETGTVKVKGHTFHYVLTTHEDEGDIFRRLEMACDVNQECFYWISCWSINSDRELKIEDFEEFLNFE